MSNMDMTASVYVLKFICMYQLILIGNTEINQLISYKTQSLKAVYYVKYGMTAFFLVYAQDMQKTHLETIPPSIHISQYGKTV